MSDTKDLTHQNMETTSISSSPQRSNTPHDQNQTTQEVNSQPSDKTLLKESTTTIIVTLPQQQILLENSQIDTNSDHPNLSKNDFQPIDTVDDFTDNRLNPLSDGKMIIEFEQTRKIISKVQSINRLELPEKPDDVPVDIIDILPFKLLLEDNTKPELLTTDRSYNFPIKDKTSALQFIAEIQREFRTPEPLSKNYVEVNYTKKPDLPLDYSQIKEMNLTIPITSSKQLVNIARELHIHYFFHKIPPSWIQIQTKETGTTSKDTKPPLPVTIEELQNQLITLDPGLQLQLPIKAYKDIETTLD
ncbi:16835_t:CDS:2, partial [Racocetra fulgida]